MQDQVLMFSIDQAVTATADSEHYIDRDVISNVENRQLKIRITVSEDFNTLTSITPSLYKTNDGTSASGEEIATLGAVPLDKLKAGNTFIMNLPIPFIDPNDTKKNLIMKYTVAGGPATNGKLTAGVELFPQTNY